MGPTGFLPLFWPSGWKEIERERVDSGERVTLGYVGAGSSGEVSEPDPNSLDFVLPITVEHFAGGTVDLIPRGHPNRPGTKLDGPRYITIHDTENAGKGAGAASHARYLKRTTGDGPATSWHFTVDDQGVYQHLPLDEVAWLAARPEPRACDPTARRGLGSVGHGLPRREGHRFLGSRRPEMARRRLPLRRDLPDGPAFRLSFAGRSRTGPYGQGLR